MQPCLLMLVAHADRRHEVMLAWRQSISAGTALIAEHASDAALYALAYRVSVVVLDEACDGVSPALLRHFRRQLPQARMLVFGEEPRGGRPPVQPWSGLSAALSAQATGRSPVDVRSIKADESGPARPMTEEGNV